MHDTRIAIGQRIAVDIDHLGDAEILIQQVGHARLGSQLVQVRIEALANRGTDRRQVAVGEAQYLRILQF